jgi:hypothetical protein
MPIRSKQYRQYDNVWYQYCNECNHWRCIETQIHAIEKPIDAGMRWFERIVYNLVCKVIK